MNKLDKIKNEFLKHNYQLTKIDLKILEKQLKRKPIQLYLKAIDWILKNNHVVSYENVERLIKNDIKIRNNVRNIITSLEEAIRVLYIDFKKIEFEDYKGFDNCMRNDLWKIIKELNLKNFEPIRILRNQVSHLTYFITYNKYDEMMNHMFIIREFDFIDKNIFDKYITSIKKIKSEIF